MNTAFEGCHPFTSFLYFAAVLSFSMIFTHPLALGVSLLCAAGYAGYLTRGKSLRFSFLYLLPVLLLTAALNPLFNHEGATILTYLPDGNPLTLESILYGLSSATMLSAVISWFSAFNVVMTSDKLVYLFGRIAPGFSLLFSMTLRFVPRFRAELSRLAEAQAALGRDASHGSFSCRIRRGVAILSAMITWALENAIDTADSMKSRGYGLPGRGAYSIFRMSRRDIALTVWIAAASAGIVAGSASGGLSWKYFPRVSGSFGGPLTYGILALFLLLCATPLLLTLWEAVRWRASRSSI